LPDPKEDVITRDRLLEVVVLGLYHPPLTCPVGFFESSRLRLPYC
jgi:hypothetical protein